MEEADGIIAEFKVSITWGEKSYIQSIFSEVRNMPLKQKVCTPGIRLQPGRWKTPKLPKGGIQNVKVKDFLKFEEIKTLSKPSPKSNLWINLPIYKSVIFRNIINVRDIAKGREIIKV